MTPLRRGVSIALAAVALLLTVVGLIDPLEGGIALLAAIALTVGARLTSRVPLPRLQVIGLTAAVVIGTVLIIVVVVTVVPEPEPAGNPLVSVVAALWVYRAAVVVAIAGATQYLVRIIMRHTPRGATEATQAGVA